MDSNAAGFLLRGRALTMTAQLTANMDIISDHPSHRYATIVLEELGDGHRESRPVRDVIAASAYFG